MNQCDVKHGQMLRGILKVFVATSMLFGVPGIVLAELITPLTLQDKVDVADSIVHARCVEVTSEFSGNRIVTTAKFAVIRDLTKTGLSQITVTTPGGTALHPVLQTSVTTTVSGMVTMTQGDEVVLFTNNARDGSTRMVGNSQGYVRVHRDPADNVSKVASPQRKVVAKKDGGAKRTDDRDTEVVLVYEELDLDEFLSRIDRSIQAKRSGDHDERVR